MKRWRQGMEFCMYLERWSFLHVLLSLTASAVCWEVLETEQKAFAECDNSHMGGRRRDGAGIMGCGEGSEKMMKLGRGSAGLLEHSNGVSGKSDWALVLEMGGKVRQ